MDGVSFTFCVYFEMKQFLLKQVNHVYVYVQRCLEIFGRMRMRRVRDCEQTRFKLCENNL